MSSKDSWNASRRAEELRLERFRLAERQRLAELKRQQAELERQRLEPGRSKRA